VQINYCDWFAWCVVTAVALLLLLNDKCKLESLQRDGRPGWRFHETARCKARTCFIENTTSFSENNSWTFLCLVAWFSTCLLHRHFCVLIWLNRLCSTRWRPHCGACLVWAAVESWAQLWFCCRFVKVEARYVSWTWLGTSATLHTSRLRTHWYARCFRQVDDLTLRFTISAYLALRFRFCSIWIGFQD